MTRYTLLLEFNGSYYAMYCSAVPDLSAVLPAIGESAVWLCQWESLLGCVSGSFCLAVSVGVSAWLCGWWVVMWICLSGVTCDRVAVSGKRHFLSLSVSSRGLSRCLPVLESHCDLPAIWVSAWPCCGAVAVWISHWQSALAEKLGWLACVFIVCVLFVRRFKSCFRLYWSAGAVQYLSWVVEISCLELYLGQAVINWSCCAVSVSGCLSQSKCELVVVCFYEVARSTIGITVVFQFAFIRSVSKEW